MTRMPKTRFSTSFSGSSRELEQRFRNLFQGAKRRPAVLAIALVVTAAALCGNLVSCQNALADLPPSSLPVSSPSPSPSPAPSHSPLTEEKLADVLLQGALAQELLPPDTGEDVQASFLACVEQNGNYLAAAQCSVGSHSALVMGVWNGEEERLSGSLFATPAQWGQPQVVAYRDGAQGHLLYTHNTQQQGYVYGEAGAVDFDGEGLRWTWPVEGDLREEGSAARGYETYWQTHLALLAPGGLEIFSQDDAFGPYDGSPAQWTAEEWLTFYPCPEGALPIGRIWKTRAWLEEKTREEGVNAERFNPDDCSNLSAYWRILSLTPVEEGGEEYQLLCVSDHADQKRILSVRLTFDEDGEPHGIPEAQWEEAGAGGADS